MLIFDDIDDDDYNDDGSSGDDVKTGQASHIA